MATVKNAKSKETSKRPAVWTDIKGEMYLFGKAFKTGKKNDYRLAFSTSLYARDDDGEGHNLYFNVRFASCDAPDKAGMWCIKIGKGFMVLDVWDGGQRPCVVVTSYDVIEEPDDDEEF